MPDPGKLLLRVEADVGKRPYCTRMEDESPFFIGGMWDVWHTREEDRLYTLTVLTTFPNEVSGIVHDRMPVIVPTEGLSVTRTIAKRPGAWNGCGSRATKRSTSTMSS